MNSGAQKKDAVRILVVDDSMLMRTLVQESLLKAGFQVFTAVDGMQAWELLQKEPVHLVVMDMYMPRLDGLELTRMIRADKQFGRLPIILMSAIDTNEDLQHGLMYGANDYVMKERRDLESLAERILKMVRASTNGS